MIPEGGSGIWNKYHISCAVWVSSPIGYTLNQKGQSIGKTFLHLKTVDLSGNKAGIKSVVIESWEVLSASTRLDSRMDIR